MTPHHMAAARGTELPGARFVARAAGAMVRFAAEMRRRRAISRSQRHLDTLPDYVLKDIGMHRSEISAIIRFGQSEYGR